MGYRSAAGTAHFEQEIKKSRFLGIVAPVSSAAEVAATLDAVREEHSSATHHCWAYVLGDPEKNPEMRMEDAGEPSGTAGRPILDVIRHRELGDVLVVVVRYFGGVKLGASGLTRAYASTASRALDAATLESRTPLLDARLRVDYAEESPVRRLLDELAIEVAGVSYGEGVELYLRLRSEAFPVLEERLGNLTRGRAELDQKLDGGS